jgi:hypothetical protein
MGATGTSIVSAISHYRTKLDGTPLRCITMHLIVTPEYLKNVLAAQPDTVIYAPSRPRAVPPEILTSVPGTHWDEERGLDERQ